MNRKASSNRPGGGEMHHEQRKVHMKAAILRAYNTPMQVEEVEVDEPKGTEVLVHIAASGICGSDVHVYRGHSNIQGGLPMILGHEGAGVVEAVGPDATQFKVGDRVLIAMGGEPCGHCYNCMRGRPDKCLNSMGGVYGEMKDGTLRKHIGDEGIHSFTGVGSFGEYTVVGEGKLVKVEVDAPFESICMVPCGVSTGVGAVFNASDVGPGSNVIVFGCGTVGLSIIQAARIAGAAHIVAIDINQGKLDFAAELGATDLILCPDDTKELAAKVKEILPYGADCAFDAVGGKVERVNELMDMTDSGGLTVLVGMIGWNQDVPVKGRNLMLTHKRLAGISGGNGYFRRDFPRTLDLYATGRLKLDEMVGMCYELDDINTAMDRAAKAVDIKTVVRVSPELCEQYR